MKINRQRLAVFVALTIGLVILLISLPDAWRGRAYLAVIAGCIVVASPANKLFVPLVEQIGRLQRWLAQPAVADVITRCAVVGGALALMYMGQFQIFLDPQNFPTSSSYVIMLVGLGLLLAVFNGPVPTDDATISAPAQAVRARIRWRWLATSVFLFCFTTWRSMLRPQEAYFGELILCWGLAMAAFYIALSPPRGEPRPADDRPLQGWEHWLLLGLFVAAFLIRGVSLDKVPYMLDNDEAGYTVEGVTLRQVNFLFTPFEPGQFSQPRLYQGMVAITVKLFGANLWGARLPSVLLGALTLPFMYLLGRELRNWRTGLIAALFLLTWTLHIQFSRLALNIPGDVLFAAFTFYYLLRGLRRGAATDFALVGFGIGIAQLFWLGARLLPLVVIAYLIYLWLRDRALITRQWRLIGIMVVATVLVALPQHFYLAYYQMPLTTREGPNIFAGGHLQEMIQNGTDIRAFLVNQLRGSFLALWSIADQAPYHGRGTNLMGPFGGPLLLFGAILSLLVLWKYPKWSLPLGWGLAVIIGGSTLSMSPPAYERYVPGAPAFALLVELGITGIALGVANILKRPVFYTRIAVALGVLVAVANLVFYVDYYVPKGTALHLMTNFRDNRLSQQAVAAAAAGKQIILVGGYETTIQNSQILQYFMADYTYRMVNAGDPLEPILATVNVNQPFAFFVALERSNDLALLQQRIPGGQTSEIILEETGKLLFYIYQKP